MSLYATANIPEYRVIDLTNRCVIVHRDPLNETYRSVTVHPAGTTVSPLCDPTISINVIDLLD